jgi:hypothetical protein
MKTPGQWASKGILVGVVIAVIAVLLLSMMVSPTAAVASGAPSVSSSPQAAAPVSAAKQSTVVKPSTAAGEFYQVPATGGGPHPGVLDIYEVAASGMTSEDPAVAYDTVSYEPIINIYQSLVAYNGSSTSNFIPELSTCVPGAANGVSSTASVSCENVYGQSLIVNNAQGEPEYYTFPIDPAAHFYDPSTGASWQVYPSDVMFSLSRTMGFADLPGPAVLNGWIQTQSLLPLGNNKWDGGIHSPFNNTPENVLGSMLVNDSTYCPQTALTASGCITFNAFGEGTDWPFFLELMADTLGAGIVSCGWYTYEDAGVPGWAGTTAAKGDGPCLLPGGATSTGQAAFTNAVAAMTPTSWDSFEELAFNHPAVQPKVQFAMVGSGPYYAASLEQTAGYTLEANPAYQQPTGCKGVGGGCEPAPGTYIPKVVVVYETSDTEGIEQGVAGQTDYFQFDPTETSTVLQLQSEGKYGILYAPTISVFFLPFDLNFSVTAEAAIDPNAGELNVPNTFFGSNTVRELLVHSYPYTTINDDVWTVDGVSYSENFGGSIPIGMGNYYPTNISWPYQGGDPSVSNTSVNSASWWWTQGRTVGSPYYDAQLAACTAGSPCKFPIIGALGEPQSVSLDEAIADYIADVETITGNAIQPYSFDLSFPDLVQYSGDLPGTNPMPYYNLGWIADYPDPTDYMAAMYYANGTYTLGDSTYQQLEVNPIYNLASCGHTGGTWANLTYWANYQTTVGTPIPTGCQGPAYGQMLTWMGTAASLAPGPYRVLVYNQVEHIENQLALYLWYEQQKTVQDYAKWINPATINTNVMIGAGNDQTWYGWTYATSVSNVYFNETGLAASTPWSVTYAGTTYSGSTASITVPSQTVGNYSYSINYAQGYGVNLASGTVAVAPPTNTQVSVTFTAFSPTCTVLTCGNLTFAEGGLQSGTSWSVVVTGIGSLASNTSDPTFSLLPAGAYSFSVVTTVGYNTTFPTNGAGSATVVAATTTSQHVQFAGVLFTTYPISFVSSGLGGGSWSVKLNGFNNTTTSPTIVFWEANNTYPFAVSTSTALTPIATSGQTTVAGAAVTVEVPFTSTPLALTFTEKGLATGVGWGITVAGNGTNPGGGTTGGFTVPSTTTTAVFQVAAGTWNYSALPLSGWTTAAGSGTVAVTAATDVKVPYTLVTYAVTVFEVGLPSGAKWSVNASFTYPGSTETNYTVVTSATTTLVLNLPNGTSPYTVTGPSAIYSSPASSIMIAAAPGFAVAVFTVVVPTYSVTFSQTGVPTGGTWSVSVNGAEKNGTGATLVFSLANGTYTYVVTVQSGYTATPSGGALSVVGLPATVSVAVATTPTTTTSSSGLSTLAYELIGVFVALAVIFLITTLYFAARRKPPAATPPQSWQSTSGGSGETSTTESKDDTSTPPSS